MSAKKSAKKPKLGTGARTRKLVKQLAHEKGVENQKGLAAWIGRKKLGDKKYQRFSTAGRKNS